MKGDTQKGVDATLHLIMHTRMKRGVWGIVAEAENTIVRGRRHTSTNNNK